MIYGPEHTNGYLNAALRFPVGKMITPGLGFHSSGEFGCKHANQPEKF